MLFYLFFVFVFRHRTLLCSESESQQLCPGRNKFKTESEIESEIELFTLLSGKQLTDHRRYCTFTILTNGQREVMREGERYREREREVVRESGRERER